MSAEFDFKAYLGKAKERVEAALDGSLGPERPESLREAMRYSLLPVASACARFSALPPASWRAGKRRRPCPRRWRWK